MSEALIRVLLHPAAVVTVLLGVAAYVMYHRWINAALKLAALYDE